MQKLLPITILLIATSIAIGASVVIKKYRTASDYAGGKSNGVTILHGGKLTLAPKSETILKQNVSQIWKLAKTSAGLFAATANPATVLAIGDEGDTTHVYSGKEAAIFAMAADRKDRLYFSPSPGGDIYQYHNKQLKKMLSLQVTYVWDFLPHGDDMLVATGIPGAILQISQTGQVDTFFASSELHIRSLAKDAAGTIYAGSSDNGLIYRFAQANKPTILYDSPLSEIFAIVPTSDGYVWAAGAADGLRMPAGQAPQIAASNFVIENGDEGGEPTVVHGGSDVVPANGGRTGNGKGMVYRISANGFAQELWENNPDRVQSLALGTDNSLLVGTGDDGKIYRIRENEQIDMLLALKPSQITHMLAGKDGMYIATANLGSCFLLHDQRVATGEYLSPPIDAEFAATWGSLSWKSSGEVQFQTRSGNSAEPDNTWSDWSAALQTSAGSAISSPSGRYLQWRAVLKNGSSSATISAVDLGYLPLNIAPTISDITIFEFGTAFPDAVEEGLRSRMLEQQQGRNGAENGRRGQSFGKKVSTPGFVSVAWKASDPNKDDMQFDLYYQPAADKNWRPLVKKYRNTVYSWDSRTMPDGEYLLKIVASDAPSNISGQAQTGEKISKPLLVDNTPPAVANLQVTAKNGGELAFEANDRASRITEAYFSIDAGEWQLIYPQDGVSDSRSEQYRAALSGLSRGGHTVMVKIFDENQNIQFAHLDFTL